MDRNVIRCAVAEIRTLDGRGPETAAALIQQLSSDTYAEREEASRRLGQNIGFYAPALRKALAGPLHLEAQMRSRTLLHDAKRSQTQQIVAELRLLTDLDYLRKIKAECSDADLAVVEARIAQLESANQG